MVRECQCPISSFFWLRHAAWHGLVCADFALGSIFYSREGIVEAKLHRHLKRAVDWGQQPELHAVAVVSGMCNLSLVPWSSSLIACAQIDLNKSIMAFPQNCT